MLTLKRKAFAYITHSQNLLVFRHPFVTEAGIQVPAGSIEPGERPEHAVLREVCEETGLSGLKIAGFLGEQVRPMADFGIEEVHHRYYFHLLIQDDPLATWRHSEIHRSDSSPEPIVFEFFWVDLSQKVPELIADHGRFLPELRKVLSLNS
jgi:8-oxo-dGTP pyrophosphatase MutT (NUDIX family)